MPVHLYGNVCDMDKIQAFASKHRLFVIEERGGFGGEYRAKKPVRLAILPVAVLPEQTFTTAAKAAWSRPRRNLPGWRAVFAITVMTSNSAELARTGTEAALYHNMVGWNYRMTDAIGHWLANCRHGIVEHAAPPAQRKNID